MTYTVTAESAYSTITETYDTLQEAAFATYYHRWNKTARLHDATGRLLCGYYSDPIADTTDEERDAIYAAHHAYYWQRDQHTPRYLTRTTSRAAA